MNAKYANIVKEVYDKSGTKGLLNLLIEVELNNSNPSPYRLAHLYAFLGKNEEALDYLDKVMEEKYPQILRINSNPDFDNLRSEPRFVALIEKMGLSDYGNGD
jgi:hypothetical protein